MLIMEVRGHLNPPSHGCQSRGRMGWQCQVAGEVGTQLLHLLGAHSCGNLLVAWGHHSSFLPQPLLCPSVSHVPSSHQGKGSPAAATSSHSSNRALPVPQGAHGTLPHSKLETSMTLGA